MNKRIQENSNTPAIELQGITKSYRHFQLSAVNLQVARGTVHGLIGPNGAGKSTCMRIMMGLVKPDQGTASILGMPVGSQHSEAKKFIGYFSDDLRLYKPETLGWHMQFVRSLYPQWDQAYAAQLLTRFGLLEDQVIKGLSHGQRVKAQLLLILARQPQVLILDEPTNGLDPVAKQEVLTELMRIVEDDQRTILYSSHQTQDVEQISDAITFIDRGRVVASDHRDQFLERWRRFKLQVPVGWQLPAVPGLYLESSLGNFRVCSTNRFSEGFSRELQQSGAAIEAIETLTLEEIFVSSVTRGREETQS